MILLISHYSHRTFLILLPALNLYKNHFIYCYSRTGYDFTVQLLVSLYPSWNMKNTITGYPFNKAKQLLFKERLSHSMLSVLCLVYKLIQCHTQFYYMTACSSYSVIVTVLTTNALHHHYEALNIAYSCIFVTIEQ